MEESYILLSSSSLLNSSTESRAAFEPLIPTRAERSVSTVSEGSVSTISEGSVSVVLEGSFAAGGCVCSVGFTVLVVVVVISENKQINKM